MAIGITFDPDDLEAMLMAVVDTFDFSVVAEGGQSLGRDLVRQVALGIAFRSLQGLDPDGNDWEPNEAKYRAYKAKRYDVQQPGELGGQMLSLPSLIGKPNYGPDSIVMTYGYGERPRRTTSRSGTAMKPHELEATDTEKGEHFTESGRRFYEVDDTIREAVIKIAQARFEQHAKDLGF